MEILYVTVLFLLLFAVVFGVASFFVGQYLNPEPSLLQVRLDQIKHHEAVIAKNEQALSQDQIEKFFRKEEFSQNILGQLLSKTKLAYHYQKLLRQAGMEIPVERFMVISIVFPMAFLVMGYYITGVLPFVLGCFVVPVLVNVVLNQKKGKRLKQFNAQFPEALSLMNSALRAGHSFQSAVGIVASEMTLPIKREFTEFLNDLNLGLQISEAMAKMIAMVDLPDVRMFATAVMIQREVGGNLTEILSNLSNTIRERFKMNRQIATLTAQSRITGNILAVAPTALLALLLVFFPDYVRPLIESPLGVTVLGVCAFLQVIGFVIIMKIVKIRI